MGNPKKNTNSNKSKATSHAINSHQNTKQQKGDSGESETIELLSQTRGVIYGVNGQNMNNCESQPSLAPYQSVTHVLNTGQQHSPTCMDQGYSYINEHGVNIVPPPGHPPMVTVQNQAESNNGMPLWAADLCQQMTAIQSTLSSQNSRWLSVEKHIAVQNGKMNKMESQLTEMIKIKQDVSKVNSKVDTLQTEMKQLHSKISEYDNTVQKYSDMCDDVSMINSDIDTKLNELQKQVNSIQCKQTELNKKQDQSNERLNDIQYRSMQENLIFSGIPENSNIRNGSENCEAIIKNFIDVELNIKNEIKFDRVHRLGKFNRNHKYPRPIIAKFTYFKDKEYVKQTAYRQLRNTNYRVSEQFPQEMANRRKVLFNVAKQARMNPNNIVRLVRDRLFINNREYIPDRQQTGQHGGQHGGQHPQDDRANRQYRHPGYSGNPTNSYTNSKPQTQQPYRRAHSETPQHNRTSDNTGCGDRADLLYQTPNRFSVLQQENADKITTPRSTNAGKTKASSSPLENVSNHKKVHIDADTDSDTDSETSSIIVDFDQTQPPTHNTDDKGHRSQDREPNNPTQN